MTDKSHRGGIYRKRKEYELARNESGANADAAKAVLAKKKYAKDTQAFGHLTAGKLPPAQIDARARRYAVKLFLSHYHEVAYQIEFGEMPPKPFAISMLGRQDYVPAPLWPISATTEATA